MQTVDVDCSPLERLDLVEQHLGIDHHAVPDRTREAAVEDARRHQVEAKLVSVSDDRVTGVVAALEPDHEVGLLGEQVRHLALALVTPLGADYDDSWHDQISLETP